LLSAEAAGLVSSASDIQIVANSKDPVPPKGSRKCLVFTSELTIGAETGDENYMFGHQLQVIADDSGCFYVLDWDRKQIKKYDPAGKYLYKSEIDLFDEKGVYVGRFETDIPVVSLFFKKGKAYGVVNINGFNFIRRYAYKIINY